MIAPTIKSAGPIVDGKSCVLIFDTAKRDSEHRQAPPSPSEAWITRSWGIFLVQSMEGYRGVCRPRGYPDNAALIPVQTRIAFKTAI